MEPGDRRILLGVPADAGGTEIETSIPTTTRCARWLWLPALFAE
jgi:hypothetical protein